VVADARIGAPPWGGEGAPPRGAHATTGVHVEVEGEEHYQGETGSGLQGTRFDLHAAARVEGREKVATT